MPTALITGANRGIGLALASRYAARDGWNVVAATRDPAQSAELHALAAAGGERVRIVAADVTDNASVEALARAVGDSSIDLLVNNAGVPGWADFGSITPDDLSAVFGVNTFAPLLVTQALRGRLARAGKVVNITSVLGSIERGRGSDAYLIYAMSKAALNMFTVKLAQALRPHEIAVLSLHPGWVQTRMGGAEAAITVDVSADGIVRVIDGLDLRTTGSYLAYDGSSIPW
jgi:NAD(P)-dependent dehydrogenase (short-subunit alcohol dehydrogenase family)